jgi:hypothetical protein
VLVHESALKHGIDPEDSTFDSGNEMIIHSMKARPQYHSLLPDI